jgi:NAD-dependent SIR2 family protein deacetylase
VSKVKVEAKRRQATVTLTSIEKASQTVQEFSHPMIQVQLSIKGNDRVRLLAALQKRRSAVDFSLSTENIERLKEMMNRESGFYFRGRLGD